jgi:hypothetical protein
MWTRSDPSLSVEALLVVLALLPLVVIFIIALVRLRSARRRSARLERDLSDENIRHKTRFAARSEGSWMQVTATGRRTASPSSRRRQAGLRLYKRPGRAR